MALIRWQRPEATTWPALEDLSQLRQEMERLFESPFRDFGGTQFFRDWAPAVDLFEDRDNYVVKVEVPGMKREDIDISLHQNALTISGERKHEQKTDGGNFRSERFYGRFERTLTLPNAVSGENVKASYKDGILSITLPKAEEAKPKQIQISAQ